MSNHSASIFSWLADWLPHIFLWAAASFPLLSMFFLMYLNKIENGSIFYVKKHENHAADDRNNEEISSHYSHNKKNDDTKIHILPPPPSDTITNDSAINGSITTGHDVSA